MAAITLLFFSFCRPAVRHLISIQHLTPNEFQMLGECLVWRSRCMCSTHLLPKYKNPWVTSIGPSTLPQITHGKFCQLNILGCRYSIVERSTSTVAQCRSSRASQKWLSAFRHLLRCLSKCTHSNASLWASCTYCVAQLAQALGHRVPRSEAARASATWLVFGKLMELAQRMSWVLLRQSYEFCLDNDNVFCLENDMSFAWTVIWVLPG